MNNNKSLKKYLGLLIILLGILIFFIVIYFMARTPYEEYVTENSKIKTNERKLVQIKNEEKEASVRETEEMEQLKLLKPVYESKEDTSSDSVGNYGTMFDELIKLAQQNGLMIRSIEYDTNPTYDPIYASHSDLYNVCEFKFFFVGTYNQFKSYLADVNNKFEYFLAVSKLDVSAFSENPDYLLIQVSFTMYAKKSKAQQGVFSGTRKRRRATPASPAAPNANLPKTQTTKI